MANSSSAIKGDPPNAEILARVLEQLLNKCEGHHSANIIGIAPIPDRQTERETQTRTRKSRIPPLAFLSLLSSLLYAAEEGRRLVKHCES